MPMIPEAIVSMLACARIGAIHSVVFGGFASNELAVRIDDAKPKAIIAGSCGVEPTGIIPYKPLLDKAIDQAEHSPKFCVIFKEMSCKLLWLSVETMIGTISKRPQQKFHAYQY